MVSFTLQCFRPASRVYSSNFIDKVRIYVRGGSGGNGLPSLGGRGGKGGKVFLVGAEDPDYTLKEFKTRHPKKRFIADPGYNSQRRSLSGLDGASIYVQVPNGVTVVDAATNRKLGEIAKRTDKLLVARGGAGGSRGTRFLPAKGQIRNLNLDLKLIADVGFVGFPNAGKSTLLRRLSSARPKVAEYAFTTIQPELGVVTYPDFRKIQFADLPGLIEGAHENKGRGHVFLKHIERTHLLLFVIDVTGFKLDAKSEFRDAFETLQLLTKELELYDRRLIGRPALIAMNKMDKRKSHYFLEEFKKKLENWKENLDSLPKDMIPKNQANVKEIISISALENRGIDRLKNRVREEIDQMVIKESTQLKLDYDKDFEALSSPNKLLI